MTPQEAIFKVLTELQTKGQWVLVWADYDGNAQLTLCRDEAGANAYAQKRGGVKVQLWPAQQPASVGDSSPT